MKQIVKKTLLPLCGLCLGLPLCAQTEAAPDSTPNWTLQACLDYALAHNVQLKKNQATTASARVSVLEAKAAKMPTLGGSVSQVLTYRLDQVEVIERGQIQIAGRNLPISDSYKEQVQHYVSAALLPGSR